MDALTCSVVCVSAWAVLLSETRDASTLRRWCTQLRRSVDDVVVAGSRLPPEATCPTLEVGDDAHPLACMLAALAVVPPHADLLVYLDEHTLQEQAVIPDMLESLTDDVAGVTRVVSITDALKRVQRDKVVSGVDRAGLLAPSPPQVLRRSVLATLQPDDARDPAAALILKGHRVLVSGTTGPSGGGWSPQRFRA